MKLKNYLFFLVCWALLSPTLFGQNNYAEVLQKSMFFYECQESGELWSDNRVSWRANSALNDGADVNLDLTGGWYDAGDHVKFNFPMAFSTTALAWGGIDFADGYTSSGQMQYLKRNLRWVNDYFIKCHPSANVLWGQVGNGGTDHAWWGSAEVMKMNRPAYKIDASNPGSDLAAETAAAMAASSILFQSDDPAYAALLIQHAKQLYNFADNYRGVYSDAITDAAGYYRSYSGYNDELVWGAIWLYRATGEQAYLDKAEAYYANLSTEPQSTIKSYKWGIAWDDKSYGCYALLAKLTGKAQYKTDIERHLDYWSSGINGERIAYTPGGLAYLDVWGALRYANNTGFLAMYYKDVATTTSKGTTYRNFAVSQANYALGSNPRNSSYVVGYGTNPTKNPHHRTAHGAWANNQNGPPAITRHNLYGALAGGPNKDDSYEDDRSNYINNEVACDYNACFSGVMAALVEEFGGSPLTNFPLIETPTDEYFTGAITNSDQDRFFEWSVQVFNHTAWPSREGSDYRYRLFVDISEGLNAGLTLSDYTVTTNNTSVVTITQLMPWDESANIYYTEVTYVPGTQIWPGGDQYDSKESQIRIGIPNDGPAEGWDVTNDPSYNANMNSADRNNPPQSTGIPLYVDGVLVFGQEPTPPTPVQSISLNSSSLVMDIGDANQLTATILPTNATNKSVVWTSSNTTIATVSSTGYVTAVSSGSATITATAAGTSISATCSIIVNEAPIVHVTGVSLDESEIELNVGLTTTLQATVNPSNATDKSVNWSSSNTSVATVSQSGLVSGIAEGISNITVTTTDGSFSAICEITVINIPLVTYNLTTTVLEGGTISLSPAGGVYLEGTEVSLTAIPNEGYVFTNWEGDASGSAITIQIIMDANKSVTAVFNEKPITGCGSESPISMPFEQNGAGEYCFVASGELSYFNSWNMDLLEINGQDFTNSWGNSFPAAADGKIHIHYVSSVGWSHFEIDGTDGGPVTEYNFTSSTVGEGLVSPASGTYPEGSNVTITASPASGWEFSSWSGDASGTSASTSIIMDGDKSVTATFTEVTNPVNYTLEVSAVGDGSISLNPTGGSYIQGTVVTLTASASSGWIFSNWSGDISGTSKVATITMDSDKSVLATFIEQVIGDCDFGTPRQTPLPAINSSFNNVYVLGSAGPDLSNVSKFTINWDLSNNGLWQFSMSTNNGQPNWYVDLKSSINHSFGSAQPAISLSGSGLPGLDGDYYVTLDGSNFVMDEQSGAYSIYFSNSATAPCVSLKDALSNNSGSSESQIKVYPIPFKNELFIDLGTNSDVRSIQLFNTMGQLLTSVEEASLDGIIQIQLTIPESIYILKIKTSNDVITKTLISR